MVLALTPEQDAKLKHARPLYEAAFRVGFEAAKAKLAKQRAEDPLLTLVPEPGPINVRISRDGPLADYASGFKATGRRAALDGRRGDREASLALDESHDARLSHYLNFGVVYT